MGFKFLHIIIFKLFEGNLYFSFLSYLNKSLTYSLTESSSLKEVPFSYTIMQSLVTEAVVFARPTMYSKILNKLTVM